MRIRSPSLRIITRLQVLVLALVTLVGVIVGVKLV
jgi:hypothetical protein